jgi:hypothetical protein
LSPMVIKATTTDAHSIRLGVIQSSSDFMQVMLEVLGWVINQASVTLANLRLPTWTT